MPVAGRKPKPAGQAVNRNKPTHDWTDVVNEPFEDDPPVELFTSRTTLTKDGEPIELTTHAMTRRWWDRIRRMPHCVLWSETDWQFAVDTALVADALYYGRTTAAIELRQREKILGTTVDARRDLRIRYLEPAPEPSAGGESGVTHLDDYRDL